MSRRLVMLSVSLLLAGAGPAVAESLEGAVQWLNRVELSTPVSGVVREVAARPGERVNAGQVLARLDQRALKASVGEAKAALEHARLLRDEAQREFDRASELYDRTLLANHDLEVAKLGLAEAEARYEAAQARLAEAELALEYSTVRAPFDGVVLELQAAEGRTVVNRFEAEPLVTVGETGRMLARVFVGGERAGRVETGARADVTVAGQRYAGSVYRVGIEAVGGSGQALYPVEVLFRPDPNALPRIGQAVTVELP